MEFALLGAFILVLGLAGRQPNRKSYTLAGVAALVATAAIYFRT